MKHKAIKTGLTSVVLLLSFGGLLWSTLREDAQYYKHVDEVSAAPSEWMGKQLQLHGFAKSIRRKPDTLERVFQVENNGEVIWAQYTGVVPDTFQEDAEVVLRGTLQSDGFHVDPNGIMAKCPSKYEARSAAVAGSATD